MNAQRIVVETESSDSSRYLLVDLRNTSLGLEFQAVHPVETLFSGLSRKISTTLVIRLCAARVRRPVAHRVTHSPLCLFYKDSKVYTSDSNDADAARPFLRASGKTDNIGSTTLCPFCTQPIRYVPAGSQAPHYNFQHR